MVIKSAPLGELGANFYLVTDTDSNEMFAVDPGDNLPVITNLIEASGATLKYIILTHAHTDHIGALDGLKEKYDVPVVIHKDDKDALNDPLKNLCCMFECDSPKSVADIAVSHNDTLMLGKNKIRFLHTPGHTKGSMCILAGNFLLSGDTLFLSSIGRCDFPGGSFEEITSSIQNEIYTLPKDTVIYPGHGTHTTVEYEAKNNPYVRGNYI